VGDAAIHSHTPNLALLAQNLLGPATHLDREDQVRLGGGDAKRAARRPQFVLGHEAGVSQEPDVDALLLIATRVHRAATAGTTTQESHHVLGAEAVADGADAPHPVLRAEVVDGGYDNGIHLLRRVRVVAVGAADDPVGELVIRGLDVGEGLA
jgi:hypothetical protein